MRLKIGDIVFFTGTGFFSWAIRTVTNSRYAHVGIIYKTTNDKVYIAESLINGFVMSEYNKKTLFCNNKKNVDVYRVIDRMTHQDRTKLRTVIISLLGSRYDFLDILSILIEKLFKKEVKYENKLKFICTEVIAFIYKQVFNIQLVDKRKDRISPYDIACSNKTTVVL